MSGGDRRHCDGAAGPLRTRPTRARRRSAPARRCWQTRIPTSQGSVAFSADDRELAIAGFCGLVDVWNTHTGRRMVQVNQGAEASGVGLEPRRLPAACLLVGLTGDDLERRAAQAARAVDRSHPRHQRCRFQSQWLPRPDDRPRRHRARLECPDRAAAAGADVPVYQSPPTFSSNGTQFALDEEVPKIGVDDVVRVYDTCPACQNPRELLRLAAPHATNNLHDSGTRCHQAGR